jgi:hypothetical protein
VIQTTQFDGKRFINSLEQTVCATTFLLQGQQVSDEGV